VPTKSKTKLWQRASNCSGKLRSLLGKPFTERFLRVIAGAEIPAAVVAMVVPSIGPHLYISHRGDSGKTTGYYVPKKAETHIRHGVEAWAALQERLRQFARLNKERIIPAKAKK
jgi:hypothetical protein